MNLMWENIFKKSRAEYDLDTILSENILFSDLTKRELRFVKNLVHIRNYKPGEPIFKQGEIGVGMYIIINGELDITIDGNDGNAIYVTRLELYDFFGEIALVEDNGRRSANAIAHNDVKLLGFFKPDLQEIIDRNPSTGAKILLRLAQVLGERLKETSNKISNLKSELNKG